MSYAFYVNSRRENQCYKLDPEEVRQSANQQWPQIEWWDTKRDPRLLQWDMKLGLYLHICTFWKDNSILTIEGGDMPGIGEIALWFRSLVPLECKLYLYSGADVDKSIELAETTSLQNVVAAFNK